ncbi:MAG: hypothetical protein IJZ29_02885 [Clostridia bacterium]|nr:hypothetical protein [Clostridia bacterium]
MNYKVNENKWQELMYLINNFYKPLKYTFGKGLYPDRVTFVRGLNEEELFDPKKSVEFFTMNARSKEESQLVIKKTRQVIENRVTDPFFMNSSINYDNKTQNNYLKLFEYVQSSLVNSKTTDYCQINKFLTKAFKHLDSKDALKVARFREEALIFCVEQGYISEEFAKEQMRELPNSLMKLSVAFENTY